MLKAIKPNKDFVDQVNEVLAQNRRILYMNEKLLRAILNPPIVYESSKINLDEVLNTPR